MDSRNPSPILNGEILEFFYGILTLWESGASKVVNDFKSNKISDLKKKKNLDGTPYIMWGYTPKSIEDVADSEILFRKTKGSAPLSLLYHLRNAFAHNRISIDKDDMLVIENRYSNKLMMSARISYEKLKKLIYTIRGIE